MQAALGGIDRKEGTTPGQAAGGCRAARMAANFGHRMLTQSPARTRPAARNFQPGKGSPSQIAAAAENLSTYRALSYDLVAATVSWVGGHPKLHVVI